MEPVVSVQGVSMMFRMSRHQEYRVKEYLLNVVRGKLAYEEFWALRDISFTLGRGESLGLVGRNGSGKSTLLKLIAGIMRPTKGTIVTRGNIAPLIEINGGFDRTLTARENIYLSGAMHGHTRAYMNRRFDEIIDFAELWEFVDVPVAGFSSGMLSRLGFAIATLTDADIVIADEVLAVGDARFRQKCEKRMNEMLDHGTTILFVSHSAAQVQKVCQRAIWLEKGRIRMNGTAQEVCREYAANG